MTHGAIPLKMDSATGPELMPCQQLVSVHLNIGHDGKPFASLTRGHLSPELSSGLNAAGILPDKKMGTA